MKSRLYTSVNEDGTVTNLTYDDAGNPDDFKDWDLTWDGEDRLKTMTNTLTGEKFEFGYDFRGFRAWKKELDSSDNPISWIGYVYDGNLVTEEIDLLDPDKKIIRSYTWGLDPAGTKQQVGGIGALVSMEEVQADDSYKTYHYITDAGGNVTNLVESKTDGTLDLADTIEYGPFGQVVASNVTTGNPYRFQTKRIDSEISEDDYDYGFRRYNAELGRWWNRDPYGVNGGLNLYGSVSNNLVNGFSGGMKFNNGMSPRLGQLVQSFGVDDWGLWERSKDFTRKFNHKKNRYSGTVCSEEGDTLAELAKLITGNPADKNLIKEEFKSGQSGVTIDVKPLLEKLEERLRENIVKATQRFNADFGKGMPIIKNPDANAGLIDKFFRTDQENMVFNPNSGFTVKRPVCECINGGAFVMGRGLVNTITAKDFNSLYTVKDILTKNGAEYLPGKLLYQAKATRAQTRKGDWSYIWNWDGYDATKGPWQGENVISVGDGVDIYWGHGVGIASYMQIVDKLKTNYNGPRNMEGQYSRGSAWNGVISFYKVEKIAQAIFDLRKKAKK